MVKSFHWRSAELGTLRSGVDRRNHSNNLGEGHLDTVVVAKENLESSSSSAPLSESVLDVLRTLGLSDSSEVGFAQDSNPGRVSIVHGTTADVIWCGDDGRETTSTSQFATNLNLSPVAGDWISIRDGYIISVSPRATELRRPGSTPGDVQVLAANIDVVLVVLPIDRELNVLMLERLAVMAFDSGATPIVVLTKADGSQVVESIVLEAQETVPGVDVMTTSSQSGRGIEELRSILHQGVTAVMLGASGAGKTSLLNALEDTNELTAEVSRSGEGRHATTTRRLYRLSSGGVLLDIPGIRLLDLTIGQQGLDDAFADITELALTCRFTDCAHSGDEGCAVEAAVMSGELSARRLESWRTIRDEMIQQELSREQEFSSRKKKGRGSKPKPAPSFDDED
jgi:ribosome biogenesis GTPase / thiamine phosphate phosphatase